MTPIEFTLVIQTVSEARFLGLCCPEPNTGCWLWTGATMATGYGTFSLTRSRGALAHRVAHELFVGPIPHGLTIDHLCRVRSCVNPAHLEAVTQAENNRRAIRDPQKHAQARKTHCPHGHPFAGENLYVYRGRRKCRACRAVEWRRWNQLRLTDSHRVRE